MMLIPKIILFISITMIVSSDKVGAGEILNKILNVITHPITKNFPPKYKEWIAVNNIEVICESEEVKPNQLEATHAGITNCAGTCAERSRFLATNLNELFTDILVKMSVILNMNEPADTIIVKLVPTENHKCVMNKSKKMICYCPNSITMYGSTNAKLIIEKITSRISKSSLEDEQGYETVDSSAKIPTVVHKHLQRRYFPTGINNHQGTSHMKNVLQDLQYEDGISDNMENHTLQKRDFEHLYATRVYEDNNWMHMSPEEVIWWAFAILSGFVAILYLPPFWVFIPILAIRLLMETRLFAPRRVNYDEIE